MLKERFITLRPLQHSDKTALAVLANNKKVWDNLRDYIPHPYTAKDAAAFIRLNLAQEPPLIFAIVYRKKFCGVIGLVPQADVYRQTAEIGYWLGEPFWNKGIATVAVKLVTAYGFEEWAFSRIHAGIFSFNPASMKVLEKNGYQKEGVFTKAVLKNGELWDEHRYAITR